MIFKNWHFILLTISIFSISFALIAEYYFNLQPCELCLKQRHPYYFFIFLSIIVLFLFKLKFYVSLLIQLGAIYGMFYSIWHVGVENKLLKGPAGCASNLQISENTNDLKEQIFNQQVISCDEVIWSIFGFSAATINTVVMLFIFVFNAIYLYLYVTKQKK